MLKCIFISWSVCIGQALAGRSTAYPPHQSSCPTHFSPHRRSMGEARPTRLIRAPVQHISPLQYPGEGLPSDLWAGLLTDKELRMPGSGLRRVVDIEL